jgi:hypothetical protein
MSRLSYLKEQAARAERLIKGVDDAVTIERLRAFAADCQREIERLNAERAIAA